VVAISAADKCPGRVEEEEEDEEDDEEGEESKAALGDDRPEGVSSKRESNLR
jgi:hypothetical protein